MEMTDSLWLEYLEAWRKPLCDELLVIKSPIRDPRVRALSLNLELSIRMIDFGVKEIEGSGYLPDTLRLGQLMMLKSGIDITTQWRGSIRETEKRMRDAQKQLDVRKQSGAFKMKNADRDAEIIRRYVSREPIETIQADYNITRSRIYQILRRAGVERDRQTIADETVERDTFLGVNISKEVKEALRAEVQRRRALGEDISMSSLSHVMLRDMLTALGYPLEAELVIPAQDQ